MDPEEYLILRSPGARAEPGIRGLRAAIRGAAAAELRFETAVATRGEARALDEDPEVVAKAPVMPIVLHEPVARTPEVERDRPVAWGVQAVRASESRFTGQGITVAILDTGIDLSHPAFAGLQVAQRDFTGEGDGDGHGHGTHVAATVFGRRPWRRP